MRNNFMQHKCKYFVLLGITATCLLLPKTAGAGGINGNESRVIGVAQGTFEYDGEQYIARQSYIDQLVSYLSRDNINMTSEQADQAVNKVYSGVESAISDGYIVKVSSDKNDQDTEKKIKVDEISPEEKDEGITDINELKDKDKEKDKDKQETEKIAPTEAPGLIQKSDSGTVTAYDNTGKKIAEFDGILKNTGFSLNTLLPEGIVMIIILLVSLVAAIINISFARKDKNVIRT